MDLQVSRLSALADQLVAGCNPPCDGIGSHNVFTNGFWNTSGARTKPTCSLTNAYLAALLSAYAYPTIFSGLSLGMHKEYEARLTEVLHPLGLSQLSLLYADDSFVHDTQVGAG
ncbi:hypothetical protein HaLaN_10303 [Haematococcus lacustris]|uniref:Uncharacterized protein n=2 Tax=Haematococcus lacustris TaxID=44745 RepID=A0A699Z4I9_HAELA|nr:hypothetical protein HaLaN_10303 [Haematococcus lacustris]